MTVEELQQKLRNADRIMGLYAGTTDPFELERISVIQKFKEDYIRDYFRELVQNDH